ncbi:hypothetical protein VARIO8X_110071 [Burkholderiales bacterium 8X]|nr:hypothetical protein VARIO8X_110071 [Burkholderiales bacterium 8X]
MARAAIRTQWQLVRSRKRSTRERGLRQESAQRHRVLPARLRGSTDRHRLHPSRQREHRRMVRALVHHAHARRTRRAGRHRFGWRRPVLEEVGMVAVPVQRQPQARRSDPPRGHPS